MAKKNYDEATVLKAVSKKCRIDYSMHVIHVNNENGSVGNGTWGKIDYLCNYCGWRWMRDLTVGGNKSAEGSDKPKKHEKKEKSIKPIKMKK